MSVQNITEYALSVTIIRYDIYIDSNYVDTFITEYVNEKQKVSNYVPKGFSCKIEREKIKNKSIWN